MKTSKPISTIAYQSCDFLCDKLEELRKAHKIEFWAFIEHLPEDDEKAVHKHLYIQPACLLQTMDLQDFLIEVNLETGFPDKCQNFRNSKPDDWILYELHYPPYLATKGETRRFQYRIEDFITSDPDELMEMYRHAMRNFESEFGINQRIEEMVKAGLSTSQILITLNAPVQHTLSLKCLVDSFQDAFRTTNRNGRPGHEDPDN